MKKLEGKVALVTGGTRNVGNGIARGLGEEGATVYVTGRSITAADVRGVTDAGGKGIAKVCDHANDEEVMALFGFIEAQEGKLDILVNNAWGGYKRFRDKEKYPDFDWIAPFWDQPFELWNEMFNVGVRSNFVACSLASSIMRKKGHGFIANISYYASRKYYKNVIYGASKAAVDKMTEDMAIELEGDNIACVAVYPGRIDDNKKEPDPRKESSLFVGRAIAALAADEKVMERTGQITAAAQLAREYGFKDIDGIRPWLHSKM